MSQTDTHWFLDRLARASSSRDSRQMGPFLGAPCPRSTALGSRGRHPKRPVLRNGRPDRGAPTRTRIALLVCTALAVACLPKKPDVPEAPTRIELPALYKPVSLTELARPLPPSPEPCKVGTRQEGPVITEIVACGDRGVTRVMVLPSEAPPEGEMLGMASSALHSDQRTLVSQGVGFPANGRTLNAQRLLDTETNTFVGLTVVHPEGPWPELLTCSGLVPSAALETWCAAAISALLLPDDPSKVAR